MGFLDDLSDAWRADERFNVLYGCGIPIPPGFEPYSRDSWRNRVGDVEHHQVSLVALGTDLSGLAKLGARDLWRLDVSRQRVTDADLDFVWRFDELEELDAAHTRITDAATHGMHTLQELRWLSLSACSITDAAMEHIAGLRALEHLDISATNVTDEGLRALAFHPSLRVLNIRDSHISGEALAPLLTTPQLRQVWMTRHQHKQALRFEHERPEVELLY